MSKQNGPRLSKQQIAETYIKGALHDGPRYGRDVEAELGQLDLSTVTIRRAREALRLKTWRATGGYLWALPKIAEGTESTKRADEKEEIDEAPASDEIPAPVVVDGGFDAETPSVSEPKYGPTPVAEIPEPPIRVPRSYGQLKMLNMWRIRNGMDPLDLNAIVIE